MALPLQPQYEVLVIKEEQEVAKSTLEEKDILLRYGNSLVNMDLEAYRLKNNSQVIWQPHEIRNITLVWLGCLFTLIISIYKLYKGTETNSILVAWFLFSMGIISGSVCLFMPCCLFCQKPIETKNSNEEWIFEIYSKDLNRKWDQFLITLSWLFLVGLLSLLLWV